MKIKKLLAKNSTKYVIKYVLIFISLFIVNDALFKHFFYMLHRSGNFVVTTLSASVFAALWLIAIFAVFLFSISPYKKTKIFFILVCCASSMFYLCCKKIMGADMVYFDFASMFTSGVGWATESIQAYYAPILSGILLHIPLIISYFIFPNLKTSKKFTAFAACLYFSVVIAIAAIIIRQANGEGSRSSPSFVTPYSFVLVSGYELLSKEDYSNQLREIPKLKQEGMQNIILVIDESVRWDFLDINVDKGTTPILKQEKNLINFGKTVSYANCSQYSNALIRHMGRYNQEEIDLHQKLYIWDVMKQAGYKSYFLEAQSDAIVGNYYTAQEREKTTIIPVAHLEDDVQLADRLLELMRSTKNEKKFIIVLKKGSHFPYMKPANMEKKFKPVLTKTDLKTSPMNEILNSYQNTIYHNLNLFFDAYLKENLQFDHTVMIYTSDHGQSFDNLSSKMTHCNINSPEEGEGSVPLVILGKKEQIENERVDSILGANRLASHYDLIPLIMSYAGYAKGDIDSFMDMDTLNAQKELGYSYGNVSGYFGGKPKRRIVLP